MSAAEPSANTPAAGVREDWEAPEPDAPSQHPVNRLLVDEAPLRDGVTGRAVGFP
jgi:hypothetical protein